MRAWDFCLLSGVCVCVLWGSNTIFFWNYAAQESNQIIILLIFGRVAGNVIDEASLGSIDYAVEHLKPCLLLIMGHQSCGAVKAGLAIPEREREREKENIRFLIRLYGIEGVVHNAAVECHGVCSHDNIGRIVSKVLPSVEKAKRSCPHADPAQVLKLPPHLFVCNYV